MYDDDGQPLEPEMPRTEMRQTAMHVLVAVVVAVVLAISGGFSAGLIGDVLIVAAPVAIMVGALTLGYRAWRTQREGGRWQIYQGGMWLLLLIFLLWIFSAIGTVMS